MAANLKDEEERKNRIFKIYNYFMKTNESTRNIAKYFTENEFDISNVTVNKYLKDVLEFLSDEDKKILQDSLNDRKLPTIEDEKVKNRVIKVSDLCLRGYSIEKIQEETKESYWTIYRDLVIRLPKLDKRKAILVKEYLESNSLSNLKSR
mgnify:FL=1